MYFRTALHLVEELSLLMKVCVALNFKPCSITVYTFFNFEVHDFPKLKLSFGFVKSRN